ncbi:autotransporter-associated beta strand repeat-containing protein [Mesorhizobium sp. B2-4-3]|uniref:autotransporter-associated beta strand repeat-containing protein n=1 Tax=Mesorhizobium sp. B2-4-3 TaxID=2589946 RepID=UPI0015E2F449|nr:autotransporter-associated beta strand repeat-containing protein [Mesorhizobium sp. B2-4-3]
MTKWKGQAASYAPQAVGRFARTTRGMLSELPLLALLTGLATTAAPAANLYWDVNNTSLNRGGTGIWNLSDPVWSASNDGVSGPYGAWNNGALDDAFLGGTAGTITLGAPITVHNMTFEVSGYTVTGSTLTLDGVDPTLSVTTGSATINSTINGAGAVIKAGAGTLTLTGNNSFAGGLTVNAGTLSLIGNNSFGSSPVVTGGALSLTGINSFVGDINVNGTLTASGAAALGDVGNNIIISGGALNIGTTGGSLAGRTVTLSGTAVTLLGAGIGGAHFAGTGGLSVNPGVNLTDDTNNYTGATTFVGAGSSTFTSIGNLGQASSLGAPTTAAAGTIGISNPSGTAGTRIAIYIGDGDVSNRNWALTSNGYRGTGLSNSGTGTLTLTGAISVNKTSLAQAPSFTAATADLELLGVISGNNVVFNANAGQVLRLGDANTFSVGSIGGAGKVEAGTLANAGIASSVGAGSSTGVSGTLSYVGAGTSTDRGWSLSGTLSNDGTGALALSGSMGLSGTGTLGGSFTGADNLVSGVISGAGNLRGAGAGSWVVSGANTYTGQTIVDSGTLRAGSATAFAGSKTFQVNGGTLGLNGFDQTLTALTGTGGTLALGAAKLTIDGPTGTTASFGGSISGSGGLSKTGNSVQTLTGASTYTGDTTIGGGTLALDFSAAGGPTSNIVGSGSALVMTGGTLKVTGAANETDTQTFDGLTISAGNNTISAVSGTGGSLTVNLGAITRTGGLMNFNLPTSGNITTTNTALGGWATVNGTDYAKVVGGNILAFTDADYTDKDNAANWLDNEFITDVNGFFGTVTGTKQLGGLRYTQAVSTTVTVSPGETLGVDGTIIVAPTVLGNNQLITGGKMTGANGGVLGIQQNSTGNFTIASQIVDNGPGMGFTKAGTGLVTLTNTANSYTGATRVVQGTLAVASIGNGGTASSIGASSADSSNLVLEGSTLRYTGTGDTSDRGFTFGKSGAILGAGIEVTNANANLVFSGLVTSADGADFTKSGAGTLTLANSNNDFTGAVAVTGGLLAVSTLPNGGQVSPIGQSSSAPANLTLSGGGGLRYTGVTTTTNRGFTLGTGGGIVDVSTAGTTLTVGGQVVGGGGLTKNGAGTLILTAANTYTGGNTVNSGILRAGAANVLGNSGPMTLANTAGVLLDLNNFNNVIGPLNGGGANGGNVTLGSAILQINGGNGSYAGTISGTGGVLRTGGGTQTFSGCNNSYTGSTNLQGAISTDCIRNGGQTSGIGASGSAPTNLIFTNGTLTYTGGTVTTDRGFQLAGGTGTIGISNATTTMTFTGNVIGAGSLAKAGPGTLILSGTNTSTGNTTVSGGTLRAATTNAFGPQGVMTLNNTAGVLLDLDGYDTVVSGLNGGGTIGGNVSLGNATLTINSLGNYTYAGAISGTGGLIKNGANSQALSGCNSSYSGSTVINAGTLQVTCLTNGGVNSSIGASSSSPANLVIGNGATLQYVGAATTTDRQFTLGAGGATLDSSGTGAIQFTYGGPVTLAGNATRTLTLAGTNTGTNVLAARLDDNVAGLTSLAKTGTGTWRLTNQASTYTGATTIGGGILIVDKLADGGMASSIGASSNAAGNLVIGKDSTLRYVGTGDTTDRQFTLDTGVTYIQSSGTGALVFANTGTVGLTGTNATRTIALGGTNTGLNTMGGAIGDNGTGATTLAKNDSGTWVLTGNNSYSGNTVINDGNLMVGNGGTTGNAGVGNVIVNSSTSTLSLNRSDTFTFSGTLSGPGTLAQIGTGTSVLTSPNNAIGATTISAGTLQVAGGLQTPTIAMTGSSTLTVGGTVQAAGPAQTAITGDIGNSTININAGGILRATGDLGGGSDTVNLAGMLNTGAGALNLGAGNDTLTLQDGGAVAGTVNAGTGGETGAGDTLQVNTIAGRILDSSNVTGFETLDKQGSGTLVLTGNHSYSAGTMISGGTLQVGNGAIAGALATPTVTNNGVLAFNLTSNYSFGAAISGSGGVTQLGTGITTLTGNNGYTGTTNVNAGTLLVNGNQSGATGQTNVASGATLGGTGTIGGSVTVADGGMLSPGGAGNAPGTLTINGDLALGNSNLNVNFGQADTVGGPLNDLVDVAGNLTLDGTLNVTQTPGGNFGPGVYRIFNYGGSLTNNGLNVTSPDYFVQTSVASQVNLVNSAGLQLSFWDGNAGSHSNGVVDGGSGTWRAAGDQNWTDATGTFAAPFANASFAIFQGAAGTVTVDNTNGQVQAAGMQFAAGGYLIQGGDVALVGPQSTIRVGDGTAASATYVATISSNLTGNSQLLKTDLGTLVLSGTNSYNGGTAINGGTVQIAADNNLGDASGGLSLNGGTLHTTADITSARAVTLNAGGGTFDTDGATSLALTNTVSGSGALTKEGGGTLVLSGANSYQGGTVINGGTVQITADANLGNAAGKVTFDGGTLHVTGSGLTSARDATLNAGGGTIAVDNFVEWAGTIGGTGALTAGGPGFLALSGDNTYTGGTTIASGVLQLGTGGTTGSIQGDVVDNGNLGFDRSDTYSFDGLISGTGEVTQVGTGTTVLTADNTYAGTTSVFAGSLYIDGDQSAATGLTSVNAGTLGGNGIIGGDVSLGPGATLAPGSVGITPGMLTINGNLELADGSNLDYSFGQAGVVGGAYNDLTVVHGNLALDGTINVTEASGGNFGPGIYRVISYDGMLNDQGLDTSSSDYSVQTSIAHQVNLVNTSGVLLNFWDGAAGPKGDGTINGGDGVWQNSAGNDNWTNNDGTLNAPYQDGVFAIFAGAAGTVDVDDSLGDIHSTGMQFATGGYTIQGGGIALDGPQATIRVGDGTLVGAAHVATVTSNLTGASQLTKTDLGTLVLGGTNSYTGGTAIHGGTLQVSADANLGDATGGVSLDDGTTLETTAAFTLSRDIGLTSGTGTLQTDADLTLSGQATGAGGLNKTGAGALTLTGANSYAGSTTVTAGGLYVDGDSSAVAGLVAVGSGATIGGKGVIGGDVTVADGATLSPGSADGTPGTLAIAGNLNLSGGSVLNYSFGEAGVAGGALNDLTTVGGNLVLDGTLNVSASAGGTFGPGVYRVFSYDGTLTNNGLVVGTIPSSGYSIQTSIDHQVNLVNTEGLTFNYWDGNAGPKNNGAVNGGDGVWQSAAGNDNWANETGTANAGFADASFAIFAGQAGTVTVDNGLGQVAASGMQFMTDGYVVKGDGIELVGPSSSIVVGDGTAAGAGMTATIASALSGDAQLVKSDRGTLVLTGTNSYTGGTAVNGGTLQVSQDANLGDAAGALSFDGGTLSTTDSFATSRAVNVMSSGTISTAADTTLTLNGALTGSGAFNKAGDGKLVLAAGGSTFSGPTSVQQGTLAAGAADMLGSGSAFAVASGATLDLGGFNQAVASLNNSGSVRLNGAPGTTLTINGDYTGAGGTIFLNAALDGDASTADKLVVHGSTSGTGILAVTNVGGAGVQTVEGIKVVDVDGISGGSFTLAGDYVFQGDQAVVSGAYAYRLYQNGVSTPADGDWYLRSALINNPLYSPAVPIYEAYPGVLQSLNELGTLQQRVGNRSWTGASQGADEIGSVPAQSAIWARIEGAHTRQSPQSATTVSDYDVTTWKLQSGIDGLLYEDATGILLGGLTFHYGTASSGISSIYGVGSVQATGYGFGGTLTWYGDNGFYTDAQGEVTWYDSNLKSATLGTDLAKGNNGFGYALSIEAGQKIALQGKWTLTPQAQLSYSAVRFNSFTDPFDAAVSLSGSDVLTGRAGLSLDYEDAWTGAQGKVSRSHLYGIANLYYDFLDGNDVDVSGTAFHEHDQPLWGGLGVGGSLSWADERYMVFGEAFAKSSLKNFGDSRTIGAKLGFSVKW